MFRDFLRRGKYLVHREYIADIRVAGIAAAHALRVCHHLHHPPGGFFRGGRQLNVVVQAFAHLLLAIDAQSSSGYSVAFICGSINTLVL